MAARTAHEVVDLADDAQLHDRTMKRPGKAVADLEMGVLEQPLGRHHLTRAVYPAATYQQVAERRRVTAEDGRVDRIGDPWNGDVRGCLRDHTCGLRLRADQFRGIGVRHGGAL